MRLSCQETKDALQAFVDDDSNLYWFAQHDALSLPVLDCAKKGIELRKNVQDSKVILALTVILFE